VRISDARPKSLKFRHEMERLGTVMCWLSEMDKAGREVSIALNIYFSYQWKKVRCPWGLPM
jgi:hypothetical protein